MTLVHSGLPDTDEWKSARERLELLFGYFPSSNLTVRSRKEKVKETHERKSTAKRRKLADTHQSTV